MSIEAMSHVLNLDVKDSTRKLVLIGFANHAAKDGTAAFPSLKTISEYACCTIRTVQRHMAWLVAHGYLREGDQRHVAHLDVRRRPIVYDVAMSPQAVTAWEIANSRGANARRDAATVAGKRGGDASAAEVLGDTGACGVTPVTPLVRGDNLSPQVWGDTGDACGVTPVTFRGDTRVTQTVQEPSLEPSLKPRVDAAASPRGPAPTRPRRPTPRRGDSQAPHDSPTPPRDPEPPRRRDPAQDAAARLAKDWWDGYRARHGTKPLQPFVAVQKILRTAVAAGHPESDVGAALMDVGSQTVTTWRLEQALLRLRAGRVTRPDQDYLAPWEPPEPTMTEADYLDGWGSLDS